MKNVLSHLLLKIIKYLIMHLDANPFLFFMTIKKNLIYARKAQA